MSNGACCALCQFSVTPSTFHNQIGPFWCCLLSGWACACPRPLWVSPVNSPVRLGVSPTAASTPRGVFNQRFEALFLHAGTLGCAVCHLIFQLLPHRPAAALPTLLHNLPPCWVHQPLPCCDSSLPNCPSPPLLPVWMNVYSLLMELFKCDYGHNSGKKENHLQILFVSSMCLLPLKEEC